jgi:hypothetical protein
MFSYVPQIDSRDSLPLELLLPAQFVVVADPFQQHMGVDKQRVVKVVYDLFTSHEEFSRDFEATAETFMLDGPTSVRVHRRIRPTSLQTAIRTFRFIETDVGIRPGGQLDWMVISPFVPFSARRSLDNSTPSELATPSLWFSSTPACRGQLPATVVINGMVSANPLCSVRMVRASRVSQDGSISEVAETSVTLTSDGRFSFKFPKNDAANVLLTILDGCGLDHAGALNIQDLTLSAG